jgi:hypothetical protein
MALGNEWISRFVGTLQSYFRIGSSGPRLKDNSGVLDVRNSGDTAWATTKVHTIHLSGSNASNASGFTAPAGLSGNVVFTMPDADGSPGQVMKTDGSLGLSFVDPVSNAVMVQEEDFTQATSSPLTIFTPSANQVIVEVQIEITSAASGGAPTLSVGIAADPDRDMDELDNDPKIAALFRVFPNQDVGGTPGAELLTITPDGQTFTGTVRVFVASPS